MTDPKDVDDYTPLLNIPVELRAMIFNKLDPKSLLQLRLLCWEIKDLVDHYIGVDASLSEVCMTEAKLDSQFKFFSTLALQNVKIVGVMGGIPLTSAMRQKLELSWLLKQHSFQSLFRYPEYVLSVTCTSEINSWFLQAIMKNCFNMISLEFNPVSQINGALSFAGHTKKKDINLNRSKQNEIVRFKKLRRLLLTNIDFNEIQHRNTMTILKGIRSSVLRQFKFECWPESIAIFDGLLVTLKEFLAFHDKLNEVHLSFRETPLMLLINQNDQHKEKFRKHLTEIAESCQVEVFGLDVYSRSDWVWKPLLRNQRQLTTVQFTTTLMFQIVWNCEDFVSSSNTLTALHLQISHAGSFAPINVLGLQNCINLKEVNIVNKSTNVRSVQYGNPLIIHLSCLPERLETLALSYIVVGTEDLLTLMKKLTKLTNLILINSVLNRFPSIGVDKQCLNEILKKRSLQTVFITNLNRGDVLIMELVECLNEYIPGKRHATISLDLEISSEDMCIFTWSKVPLDNGSPGQFYTLFRKLSYMEICK